jgi:hypothetical protein
VQTIDPRVQQAIAANVCTYAVTGPHYASQVPPPALQWPYGLPNLPAMPFARVPDLVPMLHVQSLWQRRLLRGLRSGLPQGSWLLLGSLLFVWCRITASSARARPNMPTALSVVSDRAINSPDLGPRPASTATAARACTASSVAPFACPPSARAATLRERVVLLVDLRRKNFHEHPSRQLKTCVCTKISDWRISAI